MLRILRALIPLISITLAAVRPSNVNAQIDQPENHHLLAIEWSPDDQLVALGFYGGRVEIRNVQSGAIITTLSRHSGPITDMLWLSANSRIMIAGLDGQILIVDARTGDLIKTIFEFASIELPVLQSINEGSQVLIARKYEGKNLHLFDLASQQIINSVDAANVTDIVLSPTSREIALSYFAPTIEIRSATNFDFIKYMGTHPDDLPLVGDGTEIGSLTWSANGQYLLSGALVKQITLWDSVSGEKVYTVSGNESTRGGSWYPRVHDVWFAEDDQIFYSVSGDGTTRIWETATGDLLGTWTLANPPIYAAAVSNDGTKIAYGDATGSLIIAPVTFPFGVTNPVVFQYGTSVYIMNADGRNAVNLTPPIDGSSDAVISPDGSKIAFMSQRTGEEEIYIMTIAGHDAIPITDGIIVASYLSWPPTGDRLAFISRGNDSPDIFVINADSTNLTNITNTAATELFSMWSPNSEQIAFTSDRDGSTELHTVNADGSDYRRLTNYNYDDFIISPSHPVWSPDGTQIVFNNYPHISRINADGTGLFQIVKDDKAGRVMWFTNDLLVYRLRGAKWISINADGTNRKLVDLDWPDDVTHFSIPANWQPPVLAPTKRPMADAGYDRIVTADSDGLAMVTLDAGSSTLGDGELSSIRWYRQEDLMAVSFNFSTEISLEVGVHTFTVQVYTNRGLTATDDVTIIVLPAEQTPIPAVTLSLSPTTP